MPDDPPAPSQNSVASTTNWLIWKPRERATLCFIRSGDRILLIRKKRGLGAGKINAPGGKLEGTETPRDAAIRETREEIGVTPLHLRDAGVLRFQFTNGYSLHCVVFVAEGLLGDPVETDEAVPIWTPLAEIPFDLMWEDDRHWLPEVLGGASVSGFFEFEGDRMSWRRVEFSRHARRAVGRAFVAGCGFLGRSVARLLSAEGWEVAAGVHSEAAALALVGEPYPVVTFDVADASSLRRLERLQGADAVVHCVSSSRGGAEVYERVYLEGARLLSQILRPQTLLFTSSTSVYAQLDGDWVDEESAANPLTETGRILRAAEEFVCDLGGIVARLSGIYGPGRSILLRKFLNGGAVIEGDGSRWINQIHREDAACAVRCLLESRASGIFNVSDDAPITQRALYQWLAGRFQRPLPPHGEIDLSRKRGWTHKRISNQKLRSLGWAPRYPSFVDAISSDLDLLQTPP